MDSHFTDEITAKVQRYKAFYESPAPGLIAPMSVECKDPLPSLAGLDWNDRASCREYARRKLAWFRSGWEALAVVPNDAIPSFQNLAGVGAIGASFVKDAVVHLEADSNYLDAPVRDWDRDVERIGFDPDNKWFKAQMWMLEYYLEEWDGSFGLSPFTHFDPLDLCNQWRGNNLFYDVYDHPEELKALLEKATDCVLQCEAYVRERYMTRVGQEGSMLMVWVPGNYLSCDAGDLCGADTLREFGIPYTSRIARTWGGAFLHHHELGIRQVRTWEQCEGLSLQFLNRDPNTAHLGQAMPDEVLESSLRLPVSFVATFSEFARSAARWAEGRCVVFVQCDGEAQARETVRILRALNPES